MAQTMFTNVQTVERFKANLKAKKFAIDTRKPHGHWYFTCGGQIGHVAAKLDEALTNGTNMDDVELLVGWSKWTDSEGNPIVDTETGEQREGWTVYMSGTANDENCIIL